MNNAQETAFLLANFAGVTMLLLVLQRNLVMTETLAAVVGVAAAAAAAVQAAASNLANMQEVTPLKLQNLIHPNCVKQVCALGAAVC